MPSRVIRTLAPLRRVGTAALLAATALVITTTTSTLGDPATACAKKKFDKPGYESCVRDVTGQRLRDEISDAEMWERLEACCKAYGGIWTDDLDNPGSGTCGPTEDSAGGPGQLPQITQIPGSTPVPPPPGAQVETIPPLPPVRTG